MFPDRDESPGPPLRHREAGARKGSEVSKKHFFITKLRYLPPSRDISYDICGLISSIDYLIKIIIRFARKVKKSEK